MSRPSFRPPSAAFVIASLALFVALGGTGYAVTKLPKNSVGSAQVRDGSLAAKDLSAGALIAGPRGPRGEQGPAGPQGATGPQGPAGLTNTRIADLYNDAVSLSTTPWKNTTILRLANVPAGTYLVSFAGELNADVAVGGPVPVWCEVMWLPVDKANEQDAQRVSIMAASGGRVAGGSVIQSMSDFEVLEAPGPFNLWLRCAPGAATGSPFSMGHSRLAVTPVSSVARAR